MLFGIFALFATMYAFVLMPTYLKYRKSNYKQASNTSFLQIAFNKGSLGEFLTFYELEFIENTFLLCNLYIPKINNTTTEIDMVLITKKGIYVIESKHYSGWIYGDENNKNWTQTFKNQTKNKFYNPIWQNNGHINAVKRIIDDDTVDYRSFIVFSNKCTLKDIRVYSKNVYVLKRRKLLQALKTDITFSHNILDNESVVDIYYKLVKYTLANDATKRKHVDMIRKNLET